MRRSQIVVGRKYLCHHGIKGRVPVTVLDMSPTAGPFSGKEKNGVTPKQVHPMWITVRFPDGEIGRTSTKSLHEPDAIDLPVGPRAEWKMPDAEYNKIVEEAAVKAPHIKGVEITFSIDFTVPAAKAGIIDTVMHLLRAEGRVALSTHADLTNSLSEGLPAGAWTKN